jgi:hypothetical protein
VFSVAFGTHVTKKHLPASIKYYVYAFVRKSGIPYYIGRGCRNRLYDKVNRTIKPPKDKNYIKVVKEFISLEEANTLEALLIDFWGRKNGPTGGVLANLQDGGFGGSPGRTMPECQRQRMREIHLGRKQSKEWVANRFKWMKTQTEEEWRQWQKARIEAVSARHRVWWYHAQLKICFYGNARELSDQFSSFFRTYESPEWRRLRSGSRLCRNSLRSAWIDPDKSYKGWTHGTEPVMLDKDSITYLDLCQTQSPT